MNLIYDIKVILRPEFGGATAEYPAVDNYQYKNGMMLIRFLDQSGEDIPIAIIANVQKTAVRREG